ncbi:MAG: DUF2306 domain-containing protein [Pseudooceanicola sp.]
MTWPGLIHFALVLGALALGAAVLVRRKGDARHRCTGRVFAACLLVSNGVVLGIYEDSARPGIFHLLALVSSASILAGLLLARMRPARGIAHGHVMAWSYGGLVAAGLGQGAQALGLPPWPAILACLAGTGLVVLRSDFARMAGRGAGAAASPDRPRPE